MYWCDFAYRPGDRGIRGSQKRGTGNIIYSLWPYFGTSLTWPKFTVRKQVFRFKHLETSYSHLRLSSYGIVLGEILEQEASQHPFPRPNCTNGLSLQLSSAISLLSFAQFIEWLNLHKDGTDISLQQSLGFMLSILLRCLFVWQFGSLGILEYRWAGSLPDQIY